MPAPLGLTLKRTAGRKQEMAQNLLLPGAKEQLVMADEPYCKDIAALNRLKSLYQSLSEEELYYVVSTWDTEQRLQPTHERLKHRNAAPYRTQRRKFWAIAALI